MKREGISNKVLAALAAKGSGTATASAAALTTAAPATAMPSAVVADSYEDFDIGVYRKLRQVWIPVASELVNWKTGGVVKKPRYGWHHQGGR